jgi:hypothetical protein
MTPERPLFANGCRLFFCYVALQQSRLPISSLTFSMIYR